MARVEITAMTFGPFGVGRIDGKTVMVPNCAPGDLLEVEIESQRRDYAIARPVSLIRPGPSRRVTPCPFLPRCGGCDWQQIAYDGQVRLKAQMISAEIARALRIPLDPAGLVERAPEEFGYRSRIRFKVAPGGRLGFNQLGTNTIVEIDHCMLGVEGLRLPRELAGALGASVREIEVVRAGAMEVQIAELSRAPGLAEIRRARELMEREAAIAGIVIRGGGGREVIGDAAVAIEPRPGVEIRCDADLFSQVNRVQNQRLVAAVIAQAAPGEGTKVLDLFCGAGNFSIPAARRGAEVMGVDAAPLAIAAAQANAAGLKLARTQFVAMRAAETAQFLLRARYRPEVVILDPPRAGAAELIASIAKLGPSRVVYVSCNLTTLVRDLSALARQGYALRELRAFDFFPNTHHVEIAAHAVLT